MTECFGASKHIARHAAFSHDHTEIVAVDAKVATLNRCSYMIEPTTTCCQIENNAGYVVAVAVAVAVAVVVAVAASMHCHTVAIVRSYSASSSSQTDPFRFQFAETAEKVAVVAAVGRT